MVILLFFYWLLIVHAAYLIFSLVFLLFTKEFKLFFRLLLIGSIYAFLSIILLFGFAVSGGVVGDP